MSQETQDSTTTTIEPTETPEATKAELVSTRRFRWKTGLAILIVGVSGTLWAWFRAPDWMHRFLVVWVAAPATVLLLVGWWTLISGLRWRTRFMGLGMLALLAALFLATFRFDRFEGDMVPIFTFRWNLTAEARAEQFWTQQPPTTEPTPSTPTTLEITPADWPDYRGHNRAGIAQSGTIRTDWDAQPPKLLWKHPVGPGWSSFAVVEPFAFTQEQRGPEEAVVCYDAETGDQVWVHLDTARFEEYRGGAGPRATPTIYENNVYTLGATGILNSLDAATGERHWTRNILEDAAATNLEWAMSASPLVYDDLVVTVPGGSNSKGVIAYDRHTGDIAWSAGNRTASYASPRLETIADIRQVLVFGGDGLAGHDAETGEELWFYEWINGPKVNAAQPIVQGDSVFLSCGYGVGSMMLDLSAQDGQLSVTPRWQTANLNLKLKFNDGVYHDGFIYGLDEGILTCLEFETGQRRWKRGRYGYGQLLLVDGYLIVVAESGKVVLVEATPERFRELGSFQAIEGTSWTHPAFARGRLYVRNAKEAACFDLQPGS